MAGARTLWKTFAVQSALLGVVVFVAVRAAIARDGVPGNARSFVTVAGTVTNLPGDPREVAMRFAFHRVGGAALCAPVVDPVQVTSGGAFSAQVPLDATGAVCPADLLDGRDVEVDVDVGALSLVRNAKVNPVPYAHFASSSGQLLGIQSASSSATVESPSTPATETRSYRLPGFNLVIPRAGRWMVILNAGICHLGGERADLDQIVITTNNGASPAQFRRYLGGTIAAPMAQRCGDVTIVQVVTTLRETQLATSLVVVAGTRQIQVEGNDQNAIVAIPLEQ